MSAVTDRAAEFLAGVSVTPDLNAGPGGSAVQKLLDWTAGICLALCVVGLLASAATWAVAHHGGSGRYESRGKLGVVVSLGAAVVIGAAGALINWAVATGGTVR
jgi:hypothetical protein